MRTVRYRSVPADIDFQDDDRLTYSVAKVADGLQLEVSRQQLGTHLSNGVFVAAGTGEPEHWIVPISDGTLHVDKSPQGKLETLLGQMVIAAWNGPSGPVIDKLITVTGQGTGSEKIVYDASPVAKRLRIFGTAVLDGRTHVPTELHLKGEGVEIPGGSEIVSIKVDYVIKRDKTPIH